jgi:hypothetical protein
VRVGGVSLPIVSLGGRESEEARRIESDDAVQEMGGFSRTEQQPSSLVSAAPVDAREYVRALDLDSALPIPADAALRAALALAEGRASTQASESREAALAVARYLRAALEARALTDGVVADIDALASSH